MLCSKCERESLNMAINSLRDDEKELIKFIFFKGNTVATYACLKNIPYSTANRRKMVTLVKLSKYLNKQTTQNKYA